MRQLILASVLLLASASAHAGELRDWALASGDTPAATDTAQPLPPVPAPEKPKQQASEPAQPLAAKPSPRAQTTRSEASRYEGSRYEAARYEAKHSEGRRFAGDEAKARRIAAKYGISW
jgi:hypothetical protein